MKNCQTTEVAQPPPDLFSPLLMGGWLIWMLLLGPFAQAHESAQDGTFSRKEPVIAAIPAFFPPHYSLSKDGQPEGFAVEMMNQIAQRAELDIRYLILPDWNGVQQAIVEGRADLVPNIGIINTRKQLFDFTSPVEEFYVSLFRRKDEGNGTTGKGVEAGSVGVVETNVARQLLTNNDFTLQAFDNPRAMLKALVAGELDYVAYPEPVLHHIATQMGLDQLLEPIGAPLTTIHRAIGVGKGHPQLLALLDSTIRDYVASDEYAATYRKWYGGSKVDMLFAKVIWTGVLLLMIGVAWAAHRKARAEGVSVTVFLFGDPREELGTKLRRRGFWLVALMVGAVMLVTAFTMVLVHQAAIDGERQRLLDMVRSHARTIEAIARYDQQYGQNAPQGSFSTTLAKVRSGLLRTRGETQFALAKMEGDQIRYLLRHMAWDLRRPVPANAAASAGDPMALALTGRSGTLISKDFRGETVLAAYEPVAVVNLGIVAQLDMNLLRAPFLKRGLEAAGLMMFVVLLGGVAFFSLGMPLVREILGRERWFRALFEQQGIGVALIDTRSGHFERINQRYCDILGYTKDEAAGAGFLDLTHPDDLDKELQELARLRNGDTRFISIEKRYINKRNETIWVALYIAPAWNEGETVDYHIAIADEISERKHAQAVTDRFFEQPTNLHMIAGFDGVIHRMNRGWEKMLGYPPASLRRRIFLEFVHPEDIPATVAELAKLEQGTTTYHFENRCRAANGEYHVLEWSAIPSAEEGLIYAIARDITEQRQAEENRDQLELHLRRAQKMEAIGQLSGGIAHDFNNILGIISGNLDLLEMQHQSNPGVEKRISTIRRATERASALTRQLLGFSRGHAVQKIPVSVNQTIQEMHQLIERSLTPLIRIDYNFAEDLWLTDIDPGEFQDALLNLLLNARDAMTAGGQISVETLNKNLDGSYAEVNAEAHLGDFVECVVSDNGEGIAKEHLETIFDPFFTTKAKGEGTGLGLSMVYGFVKRSGGFIKVYSEPQVGTTFRIYLPRSQATPDQPSAWVTTAAKAPIPHGTETLLAVDDEPELLELATTTLRGLGYRVLAAKSGEEALRRLQESGPIDLLFSDVVMPGELNGYQLAERIHADHPQIPILLTSGYAGKTAFEPSQARFNSNLLAKPYTRTELAQRVRTLLDEASEARHPAGSVPSQTPPDDGLILIGVAKLDEDHRILLQMLEDGQNAKEAQDAPACLATVKRLRAFIIQHFAREEVVMEVCEYPEIENHRQVHQLLLKEIDRYLRQTKQQGELPADLVRVLAEWKNDHVRVLDAAFAPYCEGKEEIIQQALEKLEAEGGK
jgi:hemerythrin-like metal-binding protein/PAS domain S-box-containing protein